MSVDVEFLKAIRYFSGLDNTKLESIRVCSDTWFDKAE